jgi:hypothetical protein
VKPLDLLQFFMTFFPTPFVLKKPSPEAEKKIVPRVIAVEINVNVLARRGTPYAVGSFTSSLIVKTTRVPLGSTIVSPPSSPPGC